MAWAYGFGHLGVGLGFLNFLGSVLFFFFLLVMIRFVTKGIRSEGGMASYGCCGRKWHSRHSESPHLWHEEQRHEADLVDDEAVMIARERLASGGLSPEDFASIQQGLKASQSQADDQAIRTVRLRFARGELSLEDFQAIIAALS